MSQFNFSCNELCTEPVKIVVPCKSCQELSTNYIKTVRIDFYEDFMKESGTVHCQKCKSILHVHLGLIKYDTIIYTYEAYKLVREKVFSNIALKNILSNHHLINWNHIIEIQQNSNHQKKGEAFILQCEDCEKILLVKQISSPPSPIIGNVNINQISYQCYYHFDRYHV